MGIYQSSPYMMFTILDSESVVLTRESSIV
jgi:hypothetical protein